QVAVRVAGRGSRPLPPLLARGTARAGPVGRFRGGNHLGLQPGGRAGVVSQRHPPQAQTLWPGAAQNLRLPDLVVPPRGSLAALARTLLDRGAASPGSASEFAARFPGCRRHKTPHPACGCLMPRCEKQPIDDLAVRSPTRERGAAMLEFLVSALLL